MSLVLGFERTKSCRQSQTVKVLKSLFSIVSVSFNLDEWQIVIYQPFLGHGLLFWPFLFSHMRGVCQETGSQEDEESVSGRSGLHCFSSLSRWRPLPPTPSNPGAEQQQSYQLSGTSYPTMNVSNFKVHFKNMYFYSLWAQLSVWEEIVGPKFVWRKAYPATKSFELSRDCSILILGVSLTKLLNCWEVKLNLFFSSKIFTTIYVTLCLSLLETTLFYNSEEVRTAGQIVYSI